MSKRKDIALAAAGVLVGLAISGPAAQAGLTADHSTQTFYVSEQRVDLEAYSSNGSNYVKLRDIGQAVGFNVTYDAATNSVCIDPDTPYGVSQDRLANGKPITGENVLELLRQIEQDWPAGTTWGTHNTPGTYKNEVPSTESTRIMDHYQVSEIYGCSGYAAMVSSLIFGDDLNPGRRLEDNRQLRPGDIVFIISPEDVVGHVVIALESPNAEGRFHYTDGNHGGIITWPSPEHPNMRSYSLNGFSNGYRLEVWTRYPESTTYTGNSVEAWPLKEE